jgi:hypothetical protein
MGHDQHTTAMEGNIDQKEGVLRRQKMNKHTYIALAVMAFGSITYGYSAAIIGTTLGE